ncbi:pilus assembly protein [Pararhizobium sp. YC-54]|uniref:TadE/TadG family type IV pilus assembly protein n=1 Tax=Pararhizobium sp. YC-54 TaxID=2986920 RepID=UPI0021F6B20E|nr:TadE/TadG family type IV pilus assembly protein [Pararhizobium sp. YC-54]MCW0000972.1 pilus assembly protein [Pararhizobium sp. YC-54]
MVDRRTPFSFWRDDRGVSLTEGLITFPLVLLVFAAFVEFGYAMSQWNQTVKALQYGARLAAVSDPLVDMDDFTDTFPTDADDPLNNGDAAPNDATISLSCSGSACDVASLNRIAYGSSEADDCPVLAAGAHAGMCHINPRIKAANIAVTYQRSGLGYWGRPDGPVLTMRLEVQNITFDLPVLGGLLGLDDVVIPAHPVTITTEDLKTCKTTC